jgi:hypothetical protein
MALLAHWKLDENQGKMAAPGVVADSSGHANDHSFSSHLYATSALGFWNRGRHCALNDRHITVANNADFLALNGNITIMAWLRIPFIPAGDQYIIGCGLEPGETQAENILWSLYFNASRQFGMRWEHTNGTEVTALSPVAQFSQADEAPTHIAVVRSINGAQRDVKFIVNGVDIAADVTALTAPDGGASGLCEMFREPGNQQLDPNGNFWNIRVYDTAESVANVLAVYNAELPAMARVAYKNSLPALPTRIGTEGTNGYDLATLFPSVLGQFAGGDLGAAYNAEHTGSKLFEAGRGQAGWTQELP